MSIIYSECVFVTLGIQHAMRMRYIISSSMACPIFFHILKSGKIFGKKNIIEHKICLLIFCTTFVCKFSILRRTEQDMIQNVYWSASCKVPLFWSDCNETWNFRRDFEKYSNIKFHENPPPENRIVPCGQTDGQTERRNEANCRFSQFCERF
jgi:hypothetical protein